MRKQIKEAASLISRAKDILEKISKNNKVPEVICKKSKHMVFGLEDNIKELEKMREHR